ncbi:hypothetical protein C8J57DRAFT_1706398 [Mycena rebaudengoi]|nr:hypothetical protein C8J57DRAFT_1706398 [Mycena rebaudengoi]
MKLGRILLPLELERAVFEAAALLDYKNIPQLLLVAHKVHTWLKPFLYHVLVYHEGVYHRLPPRNANGLAFFGKYNQHLLFAVRPFTELLPPLSLCTVVRNLAFYSGADPSLMPYLDRLHPFRLSIDAGGLFSGPPDFHHSIFANITHLDLMDDDVSTYRDESWKSLASLPCLTHLSFDYDAEGLSSTTLQMLLHECKLLEALILVSLAQDPEWENDAELLPWGYPAHDPRFVIAPVRDYMADWMCGAWGGADIWVRADNFIRLKRRGDIPKARCLLPDGHYAGVEV